VGEGGLADARKILDQQVPAREETGESEANLLFLPEDDRGYLLDDAFDRLGHGIGSAEQHEKRFAGCKFGATRADFAHAAGEQGAGGGSLIRAGARSV